MTNLTQIAAVDGDLCGNCGGCVAVCPSDAIYLSPVRLEIDRDLCNGCGDCIMTCPVGALRMADG